jgi:hypothetical protein
MAAAPLAGLGLSQIGGTRPLPFAPTAQGKTGGQILKPILAAWALLGFTVAGLAFATATPPYQLELTCRTGDVTATVRVDQPRRYFASLRATALPQAEIDDGRAHFTAQFAHQHSDRGEEVTFYLESGAYLGAWTDAINELWLYRDATGAVYDNALVLPCT